MPQKGEVIRIPVQCLICGKKEQVVPSRATRYKTCSVECVRKLHARQYAQKVLVACIICGSTMAVKPSALHRRKCCSKACAAAYRKVLYSDSGNPNYGNTGEKSPSWAGGKFINPFGYVEVFYPTHPMSKSTGYILEHRLVMSEYLGRVLTDDEVVHHRDENKQNNSIDNLVLLSLGEHTRLHNLRRSMSSGT